MPAPVTTSTSNTAILPRPPWSGRRPKGPGRRGVVLGFHSPGQCPAACHPGRRGVGRGAIWFSTGADEQKFANLRANPHVVLTTGCNRWDQGLDVVVEGDAVQVTDDAVLSRVAGAFAAKWDGRWQFTVRDGCFRGSDGSGAAMVFSCHAGQRCSPTPRVIRSALRRTGSRVAGIAGESPCDHRRPRRGAGCRLSMI